MNEIVLPQKTYPDLPFFYEYRLVPAVKDAGWEKGIELIRVDLRPLQGSEKRKRKVITENCDANVNLINEEWQYAEWAWDEQDIVAAPHLRKNVYSTPARAELQAEIDFLSEAFQSRKHTTAEIVASASERLKEPTAKLIEKPANSVLVENEILPVIQSLLRFSDDPNAANEYAEARKRAKVTWFR